MSIFSKRKPILEPAPETTLDRRQLLAESLSRLERAQKLQKKAQPVVRALKHENKINHYAARLRLAYAAAADGEKHA